VAVRIISWNIRRNNAAIDFAFDELGADVLLTQECSSIDYPRFNSLGKFIDERSVKRKWGNLVFSRVPVQPIEVITEYKGSLTLASVDSELGQLGLINLYGLFEPVSPGSRQKLANPGLHRRLSDLAPLLWGRVSHDFDGFLMMGDLNHDRRMDYHPNFRRKGASPAQRLMERIEDFQMTDLLLKEYPDGVQTYRPVRGDFPWQLDHAFASTQLSTGMKAEVASSAQIEQLSDHNPIVVEIL
jgi:endonuclease/exonuclease/phosphatase (EEP) superfamily protein YafD